MTLFVAIGNPLRGDDGAGHRLADLLPACEMVRVHGLTPEVADRIAAASRVVFLDADVAVEAPALERVVASAAPRLDSHSCAPETVVALAERLFGFTGEAWVCRLPVAEFPHGEGLSERAERGVQEAAAMVREAFFPESSRGI